MKAFQRVSLFFLLVCCAAALFAQAVHAQEGGNGVVRLYAWPHGGVDAGRAENRREAAVSIDSLTLGYGYRVIDDAPYLAFALEWAPTIPGDSTQIASIELSADVIVGGRKTSEFYLFTDSLFLAPYPDLATLEYADAEWQHLFAGASAGDARAYFDRGFSLENLRIDAISFYPEAEEQVVVEARTDRPASGGRVIRTGGGIFVDIPIYRPYPRVATRPRGDADRTRQPRGNQAGRGERDDEAGETTSRTRRKGSRDDDEDDEEDDDELMPAAIAGVAAIAAVAVAGGTVGYYGNTKNAPVGLAAGFVRPGWGMLLQVAVNEAVLERSSTVPEKGLARIFGFFDAFNAPIQPSIGAGVLVTEMAGDYEYDLSLSFGVAAPLGPVLLLGGVDVVSGGVDVGVAYNFRYRR